MDKGGRWPGSGGWSKGERGESSPGIVLVSGVRSKCSSYTGLK